MMRRDGVGIGSWLGFSGVCRRGRFARVLGAGVVLAVLAGLRGGEFGSSSGPAEYVGLALAAHPGVRHAEARWEAALQRVPQVRSLPDPMLSYTYYAREVETRVGPQEQALAISQRLPWFGKLGLRGDMAALAAEAAREALRGVRLEVAYRVREAYGELWYLGEATRVVRDSMDLLRGVESVSRERLRSGEGMGAVLRLQVELGRLEDRLAGLEASRPALVARMNALLDRATGMPLPSPSGLPLAPEDDVSRTPALAESRIRGNPGLAQTEREVARAGREVALARLERFPDITLDLRWIDTDDAAMPTADSGRDPILATVMVNLPLWQSRNRSRVLEATAAERAARAEGEGVARALEAELAWALYRCQDARRRVSLYREGLLAKARQAFASALQAFRTGATGFGELTDAQRQVLELELSLAGALRDEWLATAAVWRLTGASDDADPEACPRVE
ncbi:MAG: TolC family protein [Lentisphaeria bacterium]|nr:TolC family protein [Lentisphaeria bacterium]